MAAIAGVILLISLLMFKKWALTRGISLQSFNVVSTVSLGIAVTVMAFSSYLSFSPYRRLSIAFAGLAVIMLGILTPSAELRGVFPLTMSVVGIVGLSMQGLLMQYFLKKNQPSTISTDGQ